MQLWGRPNAYNVQKVMWGLDELDIKYTQHDIGSHPGDLDSVEFKKLNPHSRIPVLVDGDAVVWESNTILRYLFAEYGSDKFCPVNRLEQSHGERWMDWELATLQPDFIDLFWRFYRTPERGRNDNKIEISAAKCEKHFSQLDQQLSQQDYLAGNVFSIADICNAACLYRYFEMGIVVVKSSNLLAWYKRMSTRPAYRKNIMRPFAELKGRLDF
ncbi:MAG: glutathione S-transferase [Gammaproteobacteria bacterium]|jgi:glutathione S-transferase